MGHALVARHGILGSAVLIGITLHTLKTKYVFAGPLCMAVAATGAALRQSGRECIEAGEPLKDGMVEIKQRVPLSVNAGEDCYYFVNGTPVRVAWASFDRRPTDSTTDALSAGTPPQRGQEVTETQDIPSYETVLTLLIANPASLSGQSSTPAATQSPSYRLEGPFRLPKHVYASSPVHLGIRCTDSGILESFALLQTRLAAEESLHTTILWFSKCKSLVDFLEANISEKANDRFKVNVMFYGEEPEPKAGKSANDSEAVVASSSENKPVMVLKLPPDSFSEVLTHYQVKVEPNIRGGRAKASGMYIYVLGIEFQANYTNSCGWGSVEIVQMAIAAHNATFCSCKARRQSCGQ